jgi:hypothetical protein
MHPQLQPFSLTDGIIPPFLKSRSKPLDKFVCMTYKWRKGASCAVFEQGEAA